MEAFLIAKKGLTVFIICQSGADKITTILLLYRTTYIVRCMFFPSFKVAGMLKLQHCTMVHGHEQNTHCYCPQQQAPAAPQHVSGATIYAHRLRSGFDCCFNIPSLVCLFCSHLFDYICYKIVVKDRFIYTLSKAN